MTGKIVIKIAVMFSFFVFISTFDSSINKAFGQACGNTSETNGTIVDSLYTKIKANKNLASQVSHINITSTNLVIKLEGWVHNASDWDKIHQYALSTDCANLVNPHKLLKEKPESLLQSCSTGTKQCGDICIPDNDVCNIKGLE